MTDEDVIKGSIMTLLGLLFLFWLLWLPDREPVTVTYNRVVVTVTDPSAVCNDGSVSHSATRSGTCSYHEGVEDWND